MASGGGPAVSGRIRKELREIQSDASSGVEVEIVDGQLNHLRGTITGPDSTPYDGGVYKIDIQIPDGYPFVPPKMKFETKIWHPNVSSQTGAICLDVLKDQWSPALTIKTAMLSLQALMCAPVPDDPQDAEVATQFIRQHDQFLQTARFWTETYAQPPAATSEIEAQMVNMGFSAEAVRQAIADADGDGERALAMLLSAA